jgi:uncharacterized protein YndB with AHSA1/START domain
MTDPTATGELTYRRVHQAPRQLLFECLTRPEHLTHFWGPDGTTTPVDRIVVDLRPGGAFETVMVNDSDGAEYTMRAVYEVVDAPDRLVWTDADVGMVTTVTFVELGDGSTEVTTHQARVPAPFLSPEAQKGFASSLDRCDAYVAGLVSETRRDSTR